MSSPIRDSMAKLITKILSYSVRKSNDKLDTKAIKKKYYFKSGKKTKLIVTHEGEEILSRIFFFGDDETVEMVEYMAPELIDCTIMMSAKAVLDIVNGYSDRKTPDGSAWERVPYNGQIAFGFGDIKVLQDTPFLSDLQYFVRHFESEAFLDVRKMLVGKIPSLPNE
ncbi:MAG: hypothetical protein UY48_C0013G0017 [Candidatus Gottesmanbacteria bacterium GW2011_GWB1_49_7]|uniref:Uncharacterized protein n=1 Tax=Candidatus Gottesmanbacteria bacterium GW2011_GWB1_49_7 TaxID=1618448 RepID=A0A0G1VZ47_9BACT|nr:MAG: hypothetical protein UY48_C0013G0017 [Candidatus Gottesmanbacteria bacterium GW2011_GWB1_49_7]